MAKSEVVVAAGGVVVRNGAKAPEILVIHRQRYDDWSLPKGKADPGESPRQTAVREVKEETGWTTRIVRSLGESRYEAATYGKLVHWYAMRAVGESDFTANDEVDQVRWLPLDDARSTLTYENEAELLEAVDLNAVLTTGNLYLVRHAAAGDRGEWEGPDHLRPLTSRGERQAVGIAGELGALPLDRIITSPYVRCRQTVEPLAEKAGLPIEESEALAEGASVKVARKLCLELVGTESVLCSHGDVIPALLQWMVDQGTTLKSAFDCKKGSTWVIEVKSGVFRRARYLAPPE